MRVGSRRRVVRNARQLAQAIRPTTTGAFDLVGAQGDRAGGVLLELSACCESFGGRSSMRMGPRRRVVRNARQLAQAIRPATTRAFDLVGAQGDGAGGVLLELGACCESFGGRSSMRMGPRRRVVRNARQLAQAIRPATTRAFDLVGAQGDGAGGVLLELGASGESFGGRSSMRMGPRRRVVRNARQLAQAIRPATTRAFDRMIVDLDGACSLLCQALASLEGFGWRSRWLELSLTRCERLDRAGFLVGDVALVAAENQGCEEQGSRKVHDGSIGHVQPRSFVEEDMHPARSVSRRSSICRRLAGDATEASEECGSAAGMKSQEAVRVEACLRSVAEGQEVVRLAVVAGVEP